MKHLIRRFRTLNRIYAFLFGYFWLPCPICGKNFGGHELGIKKAHNDYGEWFIIDNGKAACWRHDN